MGTNARPQSHSPRQTPTALPWAILTPPHTGLLRTRGQHELLFPQQLRTNDLSCIYSCMIKSFKDKQLEKFFDQELSKIPNDIVRSLANKIEILNSASSLNDLKRLPGNRLEPLKGSRQGQYSIRINSQWRLCFEWRDDNVHEVELVDYHR